MAYGSDSEIFERLKDLEVGHGRVDERLGNMEDAITEFKSAIKSLEKTTIVSEVRLGVIIAAVVFFATWIFK